MTSSTKRGLVLGLLATLAVAGVARAQISPANMRSGCISIAAATGLVETSLYSVPSGYDFVLTDFSFTPSGYGTPPVSGSWMVSLWIRNFNFNSDVRWVSGSQWDTYGNNWPVRMNWSTGIVFQANESLRFGMSGTQYPAATVCWSGYLVPTSTSSVMPPTQEPSLAMRVAPNPTTKQVELSFVLSRSQPVVLGVFSVDGRRLRTLHRGAMDAGSHRLTWDGRDDRGRLVADGMYFARLEAAEGSRTTSIVRVK